MKSDREWVGGVDSPALQAVAPWLKAGPWRGGNVCWSQRFAGGSVPAHGSWPTLRVAYSLGMLSESEGDVSTWVRGLRVGVGWCRTIAAYSAAQQALNVLTSFSLICQCRKISKRRRGWRAEVEIGSGWEVDVESPAVWGMAPWLKAGPQAPGISVGQEGSLRSLRIACRRLDKRRLSLTIACRRSDTGKKLRPRVTCQRGDAGWRLSSRVTGRCVDAVWRRSPRNTCCRGSEWIQIPCSKALTRISHKVVNSNFHVQIAQSMCEQSEDVTVPHVSRQFVARFADVPLWLGMAENVEAASLGALDGGPVPQLEDIVEVTGLMLQERLEECVTSNLLMCLGSAKFHFQKMLCSLKQWPKLAASNGTDRRCTCPEHDVGGGAHSWRSASRSLLNR